MGATALSNCRAPCDVTHTASYPISRARTASSGRRIPFIAIGPSHCARNHSASFQSNAASNCFVANSAIGSASLSKPSRFKSRMSAYSMRCDMRYSSVHLGAARAARVVRKECLGGTLNEFRTSRSRFPNHVKSVVNATDENPASLALAKTSRISSRSFHTYTWNIFRSAFNVATPSAMSRGERVPRVLNANTLLLVEHASAVANSPRRGAHNA